ncbi:S66 peptidase family protein [Aureibacter tunicatorum]|uniref:Muramoyltetrapeptide carboxypeptidase n=1 Tax=Aureibacter tunicatorum TaxID=866807 RepID=A0AAE4BRP9_9BACT|nr:LD-carboxypeptidase [Aureibacter tunicatorum]MDR6238075.1 muramoyltetrapeptide carboxypeptidase [Aureibacter tunicatorum]BDD03108.1 peptidase S66 [Aureibacter tunicatorum]
MKSSQCEDFFVIMIFPPFLNDGDKIAIVSPSGRVDIDIINQAAEFYKNKGLVPVIGKFATSEFGYFAGDDSQRLEDLQWALDSDEIKAVILARGGYGMTRILDHVDFRKLKTSPKWICGFSDHTALLNKLVNLDIACVHTTVPTLYHKDFCSANSIFQILKRGTGNIYANACFYNRIGISQGKLVGGNLTLLANNIGTSSDFEPKGAILLIEELNEHLYHIDRMFVQLKRAGKFNQLKGMIIGHMTNMMDGKVPFGYSVEEIVREHTKEYGFPIGFNFPIGHQEPNIAVVMGQEYVLEVNDEMSKLGAIK